MQSLTPFRVLLVDDNPADLRLMQEAFRASGVRTEVSAAEGGEEALALLNRTDSPTPDLVMLDVRMPRMSGHDVLSDIKGRKDLRRTVVIMFSSSASERDIARAYNCHANGYILKPTDLESYFNLARTIVDFWSRIAILPKVVHRAAAAS